MMTFVVTGCTSNSQPTIAPPPPPKSSVQLKTAAQSQPVAQPLSQFDSRIAQCRNELDALQSYNLTVYQQYLQRFERVNSQLSRYLDIRSKIGEDIDNIALPKYQFTLRNICFDIRSELTRQIVKGV